MGYNQYNKTEFFPDELLYLKKNFHVCSNAQLLEGINKNRPQPIKLSTLRHQLYRMNLSRGIQIRWGKEDVKYLERNYKKKGDVELAELLRKRKKTFRLIDGKKVYKKFTNKQVAKKRLLLNLERTKEEIDAINKRNREQGRMKEFTSTYNLWTRGIRTVAKEGNIKIAMHGNSKIRFIKIEGKFIPYTRWYYHNYISSVPKRMIVFHKDLDRLNDEPDNLEVRKKKKICIKDRRRAISLLQIREKKILKELPKIDDRKKAKEKQSKLSRIRSIRKRLILEISKIIM